MILAILIRWRPIRSGKIPPGSPIQSAVSGQVWRAGEASSKLLGPIPGLAVTKRGYGSPDPQNLRRRCTTMPCQASRFNALAFAMVPSLPRCVEGTYWLVGSWGLQLGRTNSIILRFLIGR